MSIRAQLLASSYLLDKAHRIVLDTLFRYLKQINILTQAP